MISDWGWACVGGRERGKESINKHSSVEDVAARSVYQTHFLSSLTLSYLSSTRPLT